MNYQCVIRIRLELSEQLVVEEHIITQTDIHTCHAVGRETGLLGRGKESSGARRQRPESAVKPRRSLGDPQETETSVSPSRPQLTKNMRLVLGKVIAASAAAVLAILAAAPPLALAFVATPRASLSSGATIHLSTQGGSLLLGRKASGVSVPSR